MQSTRTICCVNDAAPTMEMSCGQHKVSWPSSSKSWRGTHESNEDGTKVGEERGKEARGDGDETDEKDNCARREISWDSGERRWKERTTEDGVPGRGEGD